MFDQKYNNTEVIITKSTETHAPISDYRCIKIMTQRVTMAPQGKRGDNFFDVKVVARH